MVVADIAIENARRIADEITQSGGTARSIEFDISDEESVRGLVDETIDVFGSLDGVHLNAADLSAGTLGRDCEPGQLPLDVFDRTMSVNLRGHVLLTQHALRAFVLRGGGSLVYTASAAAFGGGSGKSAYSMAKAGIVSLSRNVAQVYGKRGIRSNVVAPGYVLTEGVLERAAGRTEIFEGALALIPATRLGEPADIAAAVAFFLSDEAAWITGQVLSVDGGTTMR